MFGNELSLLGNMKQYPVSIRISKEFNLRYNGIQVGNTFWEKDFPCHVSHTCPTGQKNSYFFNKAVSKITRQLFLFFELKNKFWYFICTITKSFYFCS